MLVPFTAAAAADELSESRSMEEILDEYHRRAFEAQAQGNTRSASGNSRSGGQTLEEETVDALTNAGYEAYNVTAGNYDTLEAQLQTDFTAMGLDPEGSYIIVIHGQPEGSETNGNSRMIDPPTEEDFDGPGASEGTFYFLSETGSWYYGRRITATSSDDPGYHISDIVPLLDQSSTEAFIERLLNHVVSTELDDISGDGQWGTVLSLLGIDFIQIDTQKTVHLVASAAIDRTRVFTQLFYEDDRLPGGGTWITWYSVEKARIWTQFYGSYYDTSIPGQTSILTPEYTHYVYTPNYLYPTSQNECAVQQYLYSPESRHEALGNLALYLVDGNGSFLSYTPIISSPQYIGEIP